MIYGIEIWRQREGTDGKSTGKIFEMVNGSELKDVREGCHLLREEL